MNRKSYIKDVFKCTQTDIILLYGQLCKKLGDSNPFARVSIGAGYYEWSDDRCAWKKMTEASGFMQTQIREELDKIRQEVMPIVGERTANVIFSTPNDSYIYYNDEGEKLEVLLTAWGFKNPPGLPPPPHPSRQPSQGNSVAVSFVYDGERVPDYRFGLKTPNQVKQLQTDAEGKYVFKDLHVGENFVLFDTDCVQWFNLTIEEGKSEYQFDVTKYTTLYVSALRDGQPMGGESVKVLYGDKEYDCLTNIEGKADLRLPYFSDRNVEAELCGEKKSVLAQENETHIDFVFETPAVEPEPDPIIDRDSDETTEGGEDDTPDESTTTPEPVKEIKFRFEDVNGNPIVCDSVTFQQRGRSDYTVALSDGETAFEENLFDKGEFVTVSVNGWNKEEECPPISFSLDDGEYDYVLQEREPKSKRMVIVLSILAIVAFVVFLCLLWPQFEKLCGEVTKMIFENDYGYAI